MINTIYKKEMREVQVPVSEEIVCDKCKKVINGSYWDVTTGHHDWGNDSIDSVDSQDICSKECLCELFEEYVKRSDHRYNTEYFEVRHTCT